LRAIPIGYRARIDVIVTDEMVVDFAELGRVHPVYATYWMARHMEEAGRKVIVPWLEAGEDGIGSAVSVRHLAPALVGMRLEIEAEHTSTKGNRVMVSCTATDEEGGLLGTGETEQVILPSATIAASIDEVARRWERG
jgi:fluoroacetyl-CoA thioesterase